eukprot:gene1115-410_t
MAAAIATCTLAGCASGCSFLVASFKPPTKELRHANRHLKRRGPDRTTLARVEGWTFLHNLLHMTGEMTLQPFTGPGVVAVFNGEIYNYKSLAKSLGIDATSDGQVILPMYRKHGPDFAAHLHGEFAVVLVDFNTKATARHPILMLLPCRPCLPSASAHECDAAPSLACPLPPPVAVLSADVFSTKPLHYATWVPDPAHLKGSPALPRFAASTYSPCPPTSTGCATRSGILGLGAPPELIEMALVVSLAGYSLTREFPLFNFNLTQHKNHTRDWQKAFLQAVRVRSRHAPPMFVGLSEGYDSGAIWLALALLGHSFLSITMVGSEDVATVCARLASAGAAKNTTCVAPLLIGMDKGDLKRGLDWGWENMEPYTCRTCGDRGKALVKLPATIGLYAMCRSAQGLGARVLMSGSGADETISDYAMDGKRIYGTRQSSFSGVFPADLSEMFPWPNFYGGTQRDFLMKEEHAAG